MGETIKQGQIQKPGEKSKATDNKVEAAHNKKINDLVAGGMDQEDAIKQVQKG